MIETNKNDNITVENLLKRVQSLETNGIPGIRDFFATSALSILSAKGAAWQDTEQMAKYAYQLADAMLTERAK